MSVKQSREDRLAAKLRENLRRRKAQARALNAAEISGESTPEEGSERPPLPNPPAEG